MHIDEIENLIKQRYSEPHRHYHNFSHIENMLGVAKKKGLSIEKGSDLWWAILGHDVIYNPRSRNNEEDSFCFMNSFFNSGFIKQDKTILKNLILSTKHHSPKTEDEKTLCDLDMYILSQDEYCTYVKQVRKEYDFLSDREWVIGRSRWIEYTLNQKIYHTGWGKSVEILARKNLKYELEGRFSYD